MTARAALRSADAFLDRGNFRPIGRFFEWLHHGLVFEASEFTGVPLPTILGTLRLLMVLVLALTCTRVVVAMLASAGLSSTRADAATLYSLAFGAVLVANGTSGALAQFSFTSITYVVIVLATALAVARERDMTARSLRWHEPLNMALLGAGNAAIYELTYVAPAVALTYIAARAWASRMPLREALGTAAVRQLIALSAGFLAVFIPVRAVIASRCSQGSCYSGSDLSLSVDAVELVLSRSLTATPPAGWSHIAWRVRNFGLEADLGDLLTTSLPALLMLGICALTIRAAWCLAGQGSAGAAVDISPQPSSTERPECESADEVLRTGGWHAWLRPGVALGLFGGAIVVSSALVASLSRWAQDRRPPFGQAWRETLACQVGWSFVILGAAMILLSLFRTSIGSRIAGVAVVATLGAGLTLTLLANSRFAIVDRHDPVSSIIDHIAAAAINIDATDSGNALRCDLTDRYTEMVSPNLWVAGPGLLGDLNVLWEDRHGFPFCDPARVAEFDQ